jgi:hypothetical protein
LRAAAVCGILIRGKPKFRIACAGGSVGRAGFGFETRPAGGIAGHFRRQDLQREIAPQIVSAVCLAIPPESRAPASLIWPEARSGRECHEVESYRKR